MVFRLFIYIKITEGPSNLGTLAGVSLGCICNAAFSDCPLLAVSMCVEGPFYFSN